MTSLLLVLHFLQNLRFEARVQKRRSKVLICLSVYVMKMI